LSALTTPIAAPVVLISGEPDMPLTVSFGLDPKRAALMAGGDVGPGAVERVQMRREGDFDGRKGRRLVFKARKAHAGRGRRRGDVKRRQRLDEGLVLLASVAK
jgi:hypothetical protein